MTLGTKLMVALLPGLVGVFGALGLSYGSYVKSFHELAIVSEKTSPSVLGDSDSPLTFRVNVPARFSSTVTFDQGLDLGEQAITSDGDATFGRVEASQVIANNILYTVKANTGSGIEVDDTNPQNLVIRNTGILELVAGDYIKVEGNKISNTYSFTPDYTIGGWTKTGTVLKPTTFTDSVEVGALTASSLVVNGITVLDGNVTIGNGVSILPDTDLGSDLGSSTYRFNNLYVGTINSNSSVSYSGQTKFTYEPQDTTYTESSVMINPTAPATNGQLLGLGVAGYQRALIDEDGDITLGYLDQTSAPASDYPLNIYGHSGTRVSFTDTTGNAYFAGNVGIGNDTHNSVRLRLSLPSGGDYWTQFLDASANERGAIRSTNTFTIAGRNSSGITTLFLNSQANSYFTGGNVGIGTTSPEGKLHIIGQAGNYPPSSGTNPNGLGIRIQNSDSNMTLDIGGAGINGAWLQATNRTNLSTTFPILLNPRGGNVGIGTTNPGSLLHVSGGSILLENGYALNIKDSGGTARNMVQLGANNILQIGSTASTIGDLYLNTKDVNGGIILKATSGNVLIPTGSVGIGTTAPEYKLDITHNGDEQFRVGRSISKYTAIKDDVLLFHGMTANGMRIRTDDASDIHFQPNNATAMTIKNGGNVGIGTTSPSYPLHVVGTGGSGISAMFDNKVQISSSPAAGGTGFGIFGNTSGTGVGLYNYAGPIVFKTGPGDTTFTEGMRITNSGNVGIGTTSPTQKLEVTGNMKFTSTGAILADAGNYFGISAGGNSQSLSIAAERVNSYLSFAAGGWVEQMRLTSSGNVGIGTTNPGFPLVISATGGSTAADYGGDLVRITGTGSSTKHAYIAIENMSKGYKFGVNPDFNFVIRDESSNLDRLTIQNTTGNVGIGTTAPGAKLDVKGGLRISGSTSGHVEFVVPSAAGSVTYTLPSSDGSEGQVLTTNGAGSLSWSTITGGSSSPSVATGTHYISQNSAATGTEIASSSYAYTPPSYAFDRIVNIDGAITVPGSGWVNNGGSSGYIGFQYDDPIVVTKYNIYPFILSGNTTRTPKTWTFEGSTNGTDWVVLDTQTNQTTWTIRTANEYPISNSTAYSSYRLNFTSNNGDSYSGVAELTMYTEIASSPWHSSGSNIYFTEGNVGIGTTAPQTLLNIVGTGTIQVGNNTDAFYTQVTNNNLIFNRAANSYIQQTNTSGTLRMGVGNLGDSYEGITINSNNNVGIGTTAPGAKLEVAGNIKTSSLTTGTVYSNAGVLTNTDPSDVNLKENILDLSSNTLQKLMDLRAVSFNWKSTGDGALGFIAQEVREVFPELVGTNQDGTLGLYTTQFIPVLTKAIQEQQIEIDELKLSTSSASVSYVTVDEFNALSSIVEEIKNSIHSLTTTIDSILARLTKVEETIANPQDKLCIGNKDNPTCITAEELESLLETLPSPTPMPSPSTQIVEPTDPATTSAITP